MGVYGHGHPPLFKGVSVCPNPTLVDLTETDSSSKLSVIPAELKSASIKSCQRSARQQPPRHSLHRTDGYLSPMSRSPVDSASRVASGPALRGSQIALLWTGPSVISTAASSRSASLNQTERSAQFGGGSTPGSPCSLKSAIARQRWSVQLIVTAPHPAIGFEVKSGV